jgi:signal transduction histidine kinase
MPQMVGNLSIHSKLMGLLAVPVAGTVLLGVAGVAATRGEQARAAEERRVAVVTGQAAAAARELQEEQVRAVTWVAGAGGTGEAELAARRRRVERALAAWRAGVAGLGPTGDPALDGAVAAASARLGGLAGVRAEVDRRLLAPEPAAAAHDAMVAGLLVVTRSLAAHLEAPGPAGSARLLLAIAAAEEATATERDLLATGHVPGAQVGTAASTAAGTGGRAVAAGGQVAEVRLAAAAAVAQGELNGVRAAAGDRLEEIDRALGAPPVREVRRRELALLEPPAPGRALAAGQGGAPAGQGRAPAGQGRPPAGQGGLVGSAIRAGDLEVWRDGLAARAGGLWRVEREVAADLAGGAAARADRGRRRARDRLALAAGVVVATLVAALLALRVVAVPGRPPVPGAAVPGLARRGRALAGRQLELLEDLARDEPDPLRRRGLLGAGHLAGRLRRTAETQLAMAGEPAAPEARPLPVAALLRAAVAEAEPGGPGHDGTPVGRRVDLLSTGEVEVEGQAGTDLVHLLAELLDNAAAFSPPTAPIVVTAAADGDGFLVEVIDRGLGMTDQELAWANQRLAGGGPGRPAASDRLGLLIAGRLAARNGFAVRLGRSPAGGVTAVVRLPAARLTTTAPVPAHPA